MFASIILIIIVFAVFVIGSYILIKSLNSEKGFVTKLKKESKSDKEYFKNLKTSLEDAYIIDPETGAKLSLEQAESGNWNSDEVEYYDDEKDPFLSDEYRFFKESSSYYIENLKYEFKEVADDAIDLIESLHMFAKYSEYFFFKTFSKVEKNTMIGFVAVSLANIEYSRTNQLFCWIKNLGFSGHYILIEKSKVEEKLLQLNGVNLKTFGSYHCEPIEKSTYESQLFDLFSKFSEIKGLDIEYKEGHLFFKTKNEMTQEDINRFEALLDQLT